MTYLIALPVALVSSLLLTPLARGIASKYSFLDVPDDRRYHRAPVPLLGGVAVVISILIGWLTTHIVSRLGTGVPEIMVVAGLLLSFALGLYDDRGGMPARYKLLCQGACAVILVSACYLGGWMKGAFVFPVLVIWVIALMNAINFLDNMDGIAGGVTALASLAFALLLVKEQQWVGAILAASLCGASLGFLRFNFSPASIFLGDAGSLAMGYLLAALSIMTARNATVESLAIPVVVLGYPVFDITFVTLVRIKENRKLYHGGTDHSSHRLAACHLSPRRTAGVIYLLCLALGGAALLMAHVAKPIFSASFIGILASFFMFLGLRLEKVKSDLPARATG